ncbi:mitochondrial hypoxia responsive domain containing protein [Blumeria hordei DH14]|uniref:Mitochondrial hypoxia responsive domain containing protein n=1 Tax=Blumeria graminis f. sp. hordei (strain DH14) TaxID=546991 RepID=N1JGA3_BLUG1|nr:mitochondrial hypoxia responsive domain containing protein [Blumeria hordei DH14]
MSRPLPSSFDGNRCVNSSDASSDFYEENRFQKLTRRLRQEPLIPLGCILTSWALFSASRSMRVGDYNRTNRMFRARIYAQAFTVAAMVAGSMYWQTDRKKQKEFDRAVEERKAKEKNARWIEELEFRDLEAKEERARKQEAKSEAQHKNNDSQRADGEQKK